MKTVLFLCTGNSCRSQMAHGFGTHLHKDITFYSAGTKKHGLNPNALAVMEEIGIDISHHESNTVEELPIKDFDLVVTVCSDAHENCPYLPAKKVIHIGFEDPPRLAKGIEDKEQALDIYRRVRDEIQKMVEGIKEHL